MNKKSSVIFENGNYTASEMRDGSLIVERNRVRRRLDKCNVGVYLDAPRAAGWIDAIKTSALHDRQEAAALCRALVSYL